MTNMSTETIPTTAGAMRGERSSGGDRRGSGVPRHLLREAPGPLRFSAPQPVSPWARVREARQFGPAVLQPAVRQGSGVPEDVSDSQEYLTLNPWTPEPATVRPARGHFSPLRPRHQTTVWSIVE